MINYMGKFILNLSTTTKPLRALLEKIIDFCREKKQETQKYYYDKVARPLP